MRHAPKEQARRLLETLGVSWRIDPNAARCERSCGDPACRAKNLSRRELDAIRILIDDRTRKANLPGVRERRDRAIEAGVRVVRDPRDVTLVTRSGSIRETEAGPVFVDRECKIDGCENRANARYDRGILAGRCWEVHVPEGREQYSRQGRESHAAATGRLLRPRAELSPDLRAPAPPPPPELPPEPEPLLAAADHDAEDDLPLARHAATPAATPAAESPFFADAAEALELALERLEDAESAYRAALERFAKHPIYVAIRAEIDDLE